MKTFYNIQIVFIALLGLCIILLILQSQRFSERVNIYDIKLNSSGVAQPNMNNQTDQISQDNDGQDQQITTNTSSTTDRRDVIDNHLAYHRNAKIKGLQVIQNMDYTFPWKGIFENPRFLGYSAIYDDRHVWADAPVVIVLGKFVDKQRRNISWAVWFGDDMKVVKDDVIPHERFFTITVNNGSIPSAISASVDFFMETEGRK